MARVDDERGEDGLHVAVEIAPHRVALGPNELRGRDAFDAFGAQEGFDGVEGCGGLGEQPRQFGEHGGDLLGGGHAALVVARLALEGRQAREPAHADHEELAHVALEDGDEFQALKQRHGFIHRFGEHALVEAEPGELSVLGVGHVALLIVSVIAHDGPLVCCGDTWK